MLEIKVEDVVRRLHFDNPWWKPERATDPNIQSMPKRTYFAPFFDLVKERSISRAVVLMGPRRVGKTVMVYHAVQRLLDEGIAGNQILYLSLETPLYTGIALERLVNLFAEIHSHENGTPLYVFFDEVQYLKNWEVHLKSLVDSYKSHKFVVTGSAAAALRMKSNESGAGRFTDFLLPPLTFAEYLRFIGQEDDLIRSSSGEYGPIYEAADINILNEEFINYLNFGGYPEAVFSDTIRLNTQQFIKSDIIDKVLLRDLPSLYGISDIQELNRLFTTLAYNTGNEVSLDALSKSSGVAKNTIKRYLEYLEAAYLIVRVERVDQNAKRFQRAANFKVYLTNPSMRAALFGQVSADGAEMGALTETAIFSQWQHKEDIKLYYARWNSGEVDIVSLNETSQKPNWAVEVKWSDLPVSRHDLLDNLVQFAELHRSITSRNGDGIMVTTKTVQTSTTYKGIKFRFLPSSVYAYGLGRNILRYKHPQSSRAD